MNALARRAVLLAEAAPCGGARVRLGADEASLRPSGALWLGAARTLVAADLHFEKGSAYAARGQLLPPYDTGETLGRLEAEIEALAPDRLVFLGDSFHDGGGEMRLAAADAARLTAMACGRELVWVVGNHDAEGPRRLAGDVVSELDLAGLVLRHEPREGPCADEALGEVAGHLHPCARVAARGRTVRRRCFVTDGMRLVLPAFGAYAGGLSIRDRAFAGLFARTPTVVVLGAARTHVVAWGSVAGD